MKKIIPLILMSSLILCSCGKVLTDATSATSETTLSAETTSVISSETTASTKITDETIVGLWRCDDMIYEFREDSTGVYHINYSEDYTYFTYEIVDDVISITRENNPELTEFYTIEITGDSLILSDSFNGITTFTKINEDELTEEEFNVPFVEPNTQE